MRERGLTVFASDILDRGCPGSTVLDFRAMTERPPGCGVLISNCPYHGAMGFIEHALALGFRVVVLCSSFHFCAPASGSSACTSPAICGASTSWPSDFRTCTTPTTPARRPGRAKCTPGSCSIRTTRPGDDQSGIHSSACRAHAVGVRSCRQEVITGTVITGRPAPPAVRSWRGSRAIGRCCRRVRRFIRAGRAAPASRWWLLALALVPEGADRRRARRAAGGCQTLRHRYTEGLAGLGRADRLVLFRETHSAAGGRTGRACRSRSDPARRRVVRWRRDIILRDEIQRRFGVTFHSARSARSWPPMRQSSTRSKTSGSIHAQTSSPSPCSMITTTSSTKPAKLGNFFANAHNWATVTLEAVGRRRSRSCRSRSRRPRSPRNLGLHDRPGSAERSRLIVPSYGRSARARKSNPRGRVTSGAVRLRNIRLAAAAATPRRAPAALASPGYVHARPPRAYPARADRARSDRFRLSYLSDAFDLEIVEHPLRRTRYQIDHRQGAVASGAWLRMAFSPFLARSVDSSRADKPLTAGQAIDVPLITP